MPRKAPEEPKPLSFATPNPWSALPREVYVGKGHGKKEGATTESPVDGQVQPRIYTIRDHTLEVLMHPNVLELHAVSFGTHEATIRMEFWEHERLNRPDLPKRSTLSGNFYVADITDWDMIMGYDFMVGNSIGALPHRATLVREDNECLTWLSTDYACGSSQWNAEEENQIVQAVQAVGAKSRGDRGVQLTEYGMAPQVYARIIQTLGAEAPETDVFPSRGAPLLRKCRRHWHRGDSAWHRHWGLKEWRPMYWHGFLRHGGPPPKALHQSGLTMGKMSVHGEPKFSEGQPRVFTNQVRVKTLHELHHGPEKVKILAWFPGKYQTYGGEDRRG